MARKAFRERVLEKFPDAVCRRVNGFGWYRVEAELKGLRYRKVLGGGWSALGAWADAFRSNVS